MYCWLFFTGNTGLRTKIRTGFRIQVRNRMFRFSSRKICFGLYREEWVVMRLSCVVFRVVERYKCIMNSIFKACETLMHVIFFFAFHKVTINKSQRERAHDFFCYA